MNLLAGKTALVTGGSRGIGAAIVKGFAQQGANVAFTYMSSATKAEALRDELIAMGVKARCYQSDAADFAQAEKLIASVIAEIGNIDVLVNNAGITKDTLILRMTEEQWDDVIHTNLKSVFNLTKHCVKTMLRTGGSIINMSSVVGVFGNAGQANYSASKAGIIGFSKSIAKELGSRNIRCNVIAPGFINTEMTGELDEKTKDAFLAGIPLKRYGTAEEVADLCVFLGSGMSSYVTGQVISICGGLNT